MHTEYVVKVSAACMPAGCWGKYRRVAVLEVEAGSRPKMISERARGVVRIVRIWERQHVGISERCAYQRALKQAKELVQELSQSA